MSTISMRVVEVETLNPLIRRLTLKPAQGGILPAFDAGAHVRVRIGTADDWRHYSLIDLVGDGSRTGEPRDYLIAVRREDGGVDETRLAAVTFVPLLSGTID